MYDKLPFCIKYLMVSDECLLYSANLTSSVKKGKLTQEKFEKTLSRLKGVLDYESFRDVDMVIEVLFWPFNISI